MTDNTTYDATDPGDDRPCATIVFTLEDGSEILVSGGIKGQTGAQLAVMAIRTEMQLAAADPNYVPRYTSATPWREVDADYVVKPSLAEAKAAKLKELTTAYNEKFTDLYRYFPVECLGWVIQLREAQNVLDGGESAVLTSWVARRGKGETVAEFAQKVVDNDNHWTTQYMLHTPAMQHMRESIEDLTNVDDVQNYVIGM